jgi:hypothetical protein
VAFILGMQLILLNLDEFKSTLRAIIPRGVRMMVFDSKGF